MLRLLAFFVVVLVGAIAFSWMVDNPGTVTFVWLGSQVQTSMTVFLIALLVLVVAVLVVVGLLRAFFQAPGAIGSWWSTRRRDRGYKALSTGIIAAGAGDAILARRMTKRAEKFLGTRKEPLVRFLDAQTAMIEGDHERARGSFQQMEKDPDTRLLAMRGLYLEADRMGDEGAARHFAERAVKIAPHVSWAGGAVLESKALAGDWDGALEILDAQTNTRLVDKEDGRRLRAVLLTAKAMTIVDGDPSGAKRLGMEAHKLAPGLQPASLVAAQALVRLKDLRRASKVLEASWADAPHPDVADAHIHLRPSDTAEDRLKRALRLYDLKPGHVESELAVGHAALEAGDYAAARRAGLKAVEMEPRESAYLLLADVEEAETGEIGRVREWLAKAVKAPRDPAWTADGLVSRRWAPISPVSGRIDAFRWKVPVERLSETENAELALDTGPAGEDRSIEAVDVTPKAEADRKDGDSAGAKSADDANGASKDKAPAAKPAEATRPYGPHEDSEKQARFG